MWGGLVLAILIFAAAWLPLARRPAEPALGSWIAVALSATTAGIMFGMAAQKMFYESGGLGGWLLSGSLLAAATASPVLGASALMSGRSTPALLGVLGPNEYRARSRLTIVHGLVLIVTLVIGTATAIGLVFDPRNIDFPFASLTMAAVPFAAMALLNPVGEGRRPMAESLFAIIFLGSAVYIAFNEGPANWQSLWTCTAYLLVGLTLLRTRVA